MAIASLGFEVFAVALETVRGTAITPPTHMLNATGSIVPVLEEFAPDDQVGELAEAQREEIVRKSATWSVDGGADITKLPLICNLVLAPVSTAVLAGGEVTGTTTLVGGSGFVPASGTFQIIVGAPPAGGRQAAIMATTAGGVITTLTVTDPGHGYASAPALTFTGHTGTGASATAVISTRATIAAMWDFPRGMTTDVIKSCTAYWGDKNVVVYKTAYTMANSLKITGDASGTDGTMITLEGIAQFPTELTAGSIPAMPAVAMGPVLVPGRMQLWLETNLNLPFGTTEITGRVVSAEATIPTGVTPIFVATGPAGGVSYDHTNRKKARPELVFTVALADNVQTALFVAGTTVKARVRFQNATPIETTLYPWIDIDMQGKLQKLDWGDLEGAERTATFTIGGVRCDQLASDCRVRIQNSSVAL